MWKAQTPKEKEASASVEIVLVMAAHQPFGLLMSQVYNIVRPQSEGIRALTLPQPAKGRYWGEIAYQDGRLRVLELARMLQMPLVEPIDRSKILLTGALQPNGALTDSFGLAVDDILAVQHLPLNDLRLLPEWLCRKRLGKLVWAMALVERAVLAQQGANTELDTENLLAPVHLADFMSEAVSFGADLGLAVPSQSAAASVSASPALTFTAGSPSEKAGGSQEQSRRPVVLLNLEALKTFAFSD